MKNPAPYRYDIVGSFLRTEGHPRSTQPGLKPAKFPLKKLAQGRRCRDHAVW